MIFLFPENPVLKNYPDYEYESEYNIVNHLLVNLEKLESGSTGISFERSKNIQNIIYRGWIISPENYKRLYKSLSEKNYFLVNTPEQYEYCHLIPKWYGDFADITPFTLYSENLSDESILLMLENFGNKSVIVKDYVKSRKHEWNEACYIPDASDINRALKIIHTFIERQGENLTGGIVLREYVALQFAGRHPKSGMKLSEEYRLFFLFGKLVNIIDYWNINARSLSPDELEYICSLSKRVKSNFFTVDIARKSDGNIIVMELGDGQVSGLQGFPAEKFYHNIFD